MRVTSSLLRIAGTDDRLSRSEDAKEGIASFLEKRAPAYPDTVSEDMPDFYPWWEQPAYR